MTRRLATRAPRLCALAALVATSLSTVLASAAPSKTAAPSTAPAPATVRISRSAPAWQLSGPDRVSGRDVRTVELVLQSPGMKDAEQLLLATNVGVIELVERIGTDRFRLRYELPKGPSPQVALLAALDLTSGQLATHRLEIWGNPTVEIRSERGVWVRAQVGSASFGPVLTDKKGHARLEIVVPPGSREVATLATDQRGNVTERALALDPPPFSRLLALCSPTQPALYILALDERGAEPERPAFSVLVNEAAPPAARRLKPGLFRVDLTRETAGGAPEIQAHVQLSGEKQTCSMPRPASWAPIVAPEPEPVVLQPPVHVLLGAQLGASSNFGKVSGPWGALHVAVPLGQPESGFRLEAQAGYSRSQSSGQSASGEAFDLTLDSVPLIGGVRYSLAFGRWQASAAGSVGWAWVQTQVEQGSSLQTLSSHPLWLGGALRGAYLLPHGEAGLELGYSLLNVDDPAIRGNAGGLRATLGYLFHL
ncbi:MAG: hypothetical protein RL685_7348 [Pseudomonadota bacterium]